jgi:hypothetical protein
MRPGGGRKKGKDWENQVARILRERGWSAKRGLQNRARGDAADVVTDLPLWIECKAGRSPSPHEALAQANIASSCVLGRTRLPPVAIIHADRQKPIACMYLDDFLGLVAEAMNKTQEE